ncbi:MAG: outer membrane beta-barrel protein [Thiotrichaceae bacterium]
MCTSKSIVTSVLILFIICLIMPRTADSGRKRAETWEFYIPLSYADDANFSGKQGSSIDINEDFGFGLGFGYNFTDRFQLGGLFNWNSRSYDATVVLDNGSTQQYSNFMETSTISMNGIFYLLEGDITPFVSGSIGYTFIDTNIQDGPPTGVCWWDPWWGYVCTEYVPTRTESNLSYGAGLGVRFDINEDFSMQCSYNKSWIDIDNASETLDFDTWRLDFIFRMF